MGPSDVNYVARHRKHLSTSSFFARSLSRCGKQLFKASIRESDGRSSPEISFQIGPPDTGAPSRNPLFKALFKALPKFICWKIWLARNRIIFSNLRSPPDLVAKKVVGLLAEVFLSKFKAFPFTPTSTIESDWINSFFLPPSPTSLLPPPSRSTWQLHEDTDYLCWCNKQQNHILYFDGASKGNPGVAGAGGVIICPRGNQVLSFHWNLGIATNNQAEAYALYQGLHLAKSRNIHSLSVIGDSKIIIGYARKGSHPPNLHLKSILQRIAKLSSSSTISPLSRPQTEQSPGRCSSEPGNWSRARLVSCQRNFSLHANPMTLNTRQTAPHPTQHTVWATVAVRSGQFILPSIVVTPTHPPSHLSTWPSHPPPPATSTCPPHTPPPPPPHVPSTRPPHLTSRLLSTRSSSVCDLQPLFFPSPSLGSLFGVPWTAPGHGRENWSEANMLRMTSRMYWALIPGEVKDPSIRSDHGSNSWQILGKWLSSLNQMKRREHIIAGAVHLFGKIIPAKNRAESTPRKRTGIWFFQLDKAGNSGKMNRQPPRMVPVEEHEELVSTVQTLQLQLRALSTQVLSITEITIQHRSEQQRNRDECEALRQQIEALKFAVGPASPTPSTEHLHLR
jgi:hypothetical protein